MPAGFNIRGRIWAITQCDDDLSGGSVTTGTVIHENVSARMQGKPAEMILQQQGFETLKIFGMMIAPVTLVETIDEGDEWETTFPPDYYSEGKRYKILNILPADFPPTDPRNYALLILTRSHEAHETQ